MSLGWVSNGDCISAVIVGLLVVIFGSVLRRSSDDRLRFWFLSWVMLLIHSLLQWWGRGRTAHVLATDAMALAGTVFYMAVSPVCKDRRSTLVLALTYGIPAVVYCTLAAADLHAPWLLLAIVSVTVPATLWLHLRSDVDRSYILAKTLVLLIAGALIGVFTYTGDNKAGTDILLAGTFAFNALSLYRHFRRLTVGICTSILGFLTWGTIWPFASWLQHAGGARLPAMWCNIPMIFVAVGMLLTLLEQETRAVALQAARNRDLYDRSLCGLFRSTLDGRVLDCNQTLAELNDCSSREQMIGMSVFESYADPEERVRWAEELRSNGVVEGVEIRLVSGTGEMRTVLLNAKLRYDEQRQPLDIEGVILDVTERVRLRDELAYLAQHDPLTGLPNRVLLADRASQALARALRHARPMAVLVIDLDRFKHINDTYGHDVGDKLLQAVTERMRARLRACDTLARVGGDEFVAILEEISQPEDALNVASDLLASLEDRIALGELNLRASVSVGVAVFPEDGTSFEDLRVHADHALYCSKEAGRHQFRRFQPDMATAIRHADKIEQGLRDALETGRLELHYQPLCSPDGTVRKLEALLRFRHPELGNVAPSQFIPIAEETGIIVEIGMWVLRRVCEQIRKWKREGVEVVPVAVNVSALQFHRSEFADAVRLVLAEMNIEPGLLELELTESLLMRNVQESAAQLQRLKQIGISIAVDDFGTGYSSLSYLHTLPLDTIKIDRSFVQTLASQQGARSIVEAILDLGRSLGLTVVAEGMETAEQLQTLSSLGCDLMQGYFFARPASADKAGRLLQTGVLRERRGA
jgi:diguanylate cyclase (GGDEF)-like protein/PAS domain S-box-containing protein